MLRSAASSRLLRTVQHLRQLQVSAAAMDGDGGSGGDPASEHQNFIKTTGEQGIEYFSPPDSKTPFSRVVKAGGMVYVSGAGTGNGPDGKPRVGTAAEETRWALENVAAILKAAGSSMDLVVQVFCLVQDKADYADINTEYVKHWKILPARSTTHGFAGGSGKVGFGCIALVKDS